MKKIYFSKGKLRPIFKGFQQLFLLLTIQLSFIFNSYSQVDTGGNFNASNHDKQIVGYITQWDAWKAANAGLPAQGALTHLNIDYSKYTILNYSFFGVAVDGSLHSGDLRNPNIYQTGEVQQPGDLLFTDIYSSWDFHILFGELDAVQYINEDVKTRAESFGYVVELNGTSWSHPGWGLEGPLPLPLPTVGGAPGLLDLAHQNGVKVMASIGGWSMCKHFPEMAADPVKRARFIADCEKLINMGFDGIDLDWEYPGPYSGMNFTGTEADFDNFENLVQEIRNAIGADKLITAAFSADPAKLQGLDWAALSTTMDYFNMMTYDFNGGFSNKAGHNAALYNYDDAETANFNWHSTFTGLTSLGVDPSKINMGSPFYGRGVVTDGPADLNVATVKRNETVAPDGPISTASDFTNWPRDVYDGTPNYAYIKQQALGPNSAWTEHWDDQAKVPYLTKDNFFLSYDNEESIGLKAQYVVDNNIAGTIIWTVYGDLEFSGMQENFGTKLKRWSNVKSDLVNKINDVFAAGGDGNGNVAPLASWVNPFEATSFDLGAVISLEASASDSDGSITKVEFFAGTNKLGEATASPYTLDWTNAAVGQYTLTARATDNEGKTGSSTAIVITVNDPALDSPQISLVSPLDNAEVTTGESVSISAIASDSDGTITSVTFLVAGQTIFPVLNNGLYSANWTPVSDGQYVILATAVDNDNLENTVQVTVTAATTVGSCSAAPWDASVVYLGGDQVSYEGVLYQSNWWNQNASPATNSDPYEVWTNMGPCDGLELNQSPVVSISSPTTNASLLEGSILISADASDSDGSITKVEFFVNGINVGEDLTAPYGVTYAFTEGNFNLTVMATDDDAATTVSGIVVVTITEEGANIAPIVNITSPAQNATFVEGAMIDLTADATDSDGTVTLVEYFVDGSKVGEDTTAPYNYSFTVPVGSLSLTAVATDDGGLSTTSASIAVEVTQESDGACESQPYVENGGYVAGSQVQSNGNLYQCKDYPFSGWCNGSAWAYEPGQGLYWGDAWTDLGVCDTNPPGNQFPIVSISQPSTGSSYLPGQIVNVSASASDTDGFISKVAFYVDGVLVEEDSSAPYSFSWTTTLGNHTLVAKATDNLLATTDSSPVSVSVSNTTPPTGGDLPDRILVGYWHNFINGAGPMKLSEVSDKWDVINISFAEPTVQLGATMSFVPDNAIYSSVQEFKNDVAVLQSQGKKVLISLGGANGAIHLDNVGDAAAYSSSMINIISEYGFDGLDIDLEGSSLSLEAGDTDFRNPTSAKIVNFINGTQTILNHFGSGFILTAAPETLYVQGGISGYGGSVGAYLPVLYAIKDQLNYIHVQHYNTGCMLALGNNSPCYQQGTADFQVAMAEMLLQGFPVPGHAQGFPALRPDQVAIGLPSSPQAAGGGYTTPAVVHQALDYLVKGISYGGNYTLVNPAGYADFRGLMTWSINWDEYTNFEFSNNHSAYLVALDASNARVSSESDFDVITEIQSASLYPNPFSDEVSLTFALNGEKLTSLDVYNHLGAKVKTIWNAELLHSGQHTMTFDLGSLPQGLYVFRLKQGDDISNFKMIKR